MKQGRKVNPIINGKKECKKCNQMVDIKYFWKDKRIKAINRVLQKYNAEASDDCYYYDEYQKVLLSSARNKREYKYVDKDRS